MERVTAPHGRGAAPRWLQQTPEPPPLWRPLLAVAAAAAPPSSGARRSAPCAGADGREVAARRHNRTKGPRRARRPRQMGPDSTRCSARKFLGHSPASRTRRGPAPRLTPSGRASKRPSGTPHTNYTGCPPRIPAVTRHSCRPLPRPRLHSPSSGPKLRRRLALGWRCQQRRRHPRRAACQPRPPPRGSSSTEER
mgnify:CR=1 FL=1|eukprot:scaffold15771_cov27-Tisochrysis_lutea.AAC.4